MDYTLNTYTSFCGARKSGSGCCGGTWIFLRCRWKNWKWLNMVNIVAAAPIPANGRQIVRFVWIFRHGGPTTYQSHGWWPSQFDRSTDSWGGRASSCVLALVFVGLPIFHLLLLLCNVLFHLCKLSWLCTHPPRIPASYRQDAASTHHPRHWHPAQPSIRSQTCWILWTAWNRRGWICTYCSSRQPFVGLYQGASILSAIVRTGIFAVLGEPLHGCDVRPWCFDARRRTRSIYSSHWLVWEHRLLAHACQTAKPTKVQTRFSWIIREIRRCHRVLHWAVQ